MTLSTTEYIILITLLNTLIYIFAYKALQRGEPGGAAAERKATPTAVSNLAINLTCDTSAFEASIADAKRRLNELHDLGELNTRTV
jgi:hypothetical protein